MAPYELQHPGEMELFPAAPPTFLAVMEGHENPENGKSYNKGKEEEGGHGIIHETEQQHKLCARGHWRPAEDAKLKELVSQYGPQNWNLIAEKLEGRSGKSCRLRWFNQLDPRINRKAFSEEEEERLLAAHRLYGNKWAQIARLLHGRTDNAVKNHWHVIMARKQREQSNARRSRNPPGRSPIFFPSQGQALPRWKEVSTSNNACSGESSISGTRDECDSTCTDLSLNSLTSRIAPSFLNRRRSSPSQQPHSFDMLDGSDEKVVAAARNASYEKLGDSGGSFFSHGARPVAYHMSTALAHGQKRHGREKTRLPFIDFLGVGAT